MVAGLASTRSILPVVLGFTLGAAVAVPAKLNRPPAAVAVASAADSSCIAFLNVLGTSPGGFAIVDNGLVRDTIVTPNPQLQRNLEYRRGRACVDSVDNKGRDSAQSALRGDYSRLVMIHAMIPEYHDEQRLSDGSGGLGPRAHVYASPNLDDFEWPWQVGEHQGSGVLVAHVFVDTASGSTLPDPYRQLGLQPGLSCVWLARVYGATNWRGFVRPATNRGVCDTSLPATNLAVRVSSEGGPAVLYPAVARFGESAAGNPLIGVRCLNAWCEMGAGTFDLRPPLPVTFGDYSPRATIKGWHDEQILSIRRLTPVPRFVPTSPPLRAALVPREGVEALSPADFSAGWQRVAELYLETAPPTGSKYASWGLQRGKNSIDLRQFAWGWTVRMTPPAPGAPRVWRVVARDVHLDAGIPGTARFRWTTGDDGMWVPCGQSCCHVEA